MRTLWLAAPGLIGLGFVAGLWAADNDPTAPLSPSADTTASAVADAAANPFSSPDTPASLADLHRLVLEERAARERLGLQVEALQRDLAGLRRAANGAASRTNEAAQTAADVAQQPAQSRASTLREHEALTALGIDTGRAERLRQRLEATEMERLYLRDRAQREGWLDTERYAKESRALDGKGDVYRNELGEHDYDRFLFMTGRPNRVLVERVLANSPGERAGLSAEDVILRYDNKRIHTPTDLTTLTLAGQTGEPVRVEVQRGERRFELFLPRGPIGIHLGQDLQEPSP